MTLEHRRSWRLLSLALCVVWVATVAQADTDVTPAMRCQRHMPCCPPGSESCSTAQCAEQVPEKAEAQVERARESESRAVASAVRNEDSSRPGFEPVRELIAGFQFRAAVLRLKDDLRI